MIEVDELGLRVLRMFVEWEKDTLDLHELFEAGDSNDTEARTAVFYKVERLVEGGFLEERGNDFYGLTAEGRKVLAENLSDEGASEPNADEVERS